MLKFFKPSPKLVTLFLAGAENRRLFERNTWKEQGGWEKKAAHAGLVKEDANGHLRGGIMKIQQWLEIPENQQEKSKGSPTYSRRSSSFESFIIHQDQV